MNMKFEIFLQPPISFKGLVIKCPRCDKLLYIRKMVVPTSTR
jgi:phage FluMu protein Com